MRRASSTVLRVGRQELEVSNLDKVIYPQTGFTKGDVIRYYIDVAPVLLPHLAGRALTMKRYPDGVGRFSFYEKNCPTHRPRWLPTVAVASTQSRRKIRDCVIDTLPEPSVSTPLAWAEVEAAVRANKADRLRFSPKDVLARVARRGDLFAPVLRLKQKLQPGLTAA